MFAVAQDLCLFSAMRHQVLMAALQAPHYAPAEVLCLLLLIIFACFLRCWLTGADGCAASAELRTCSSTLFAVSHDLCVFCGVVKCRWLRCKRRTMHLQKYIFDSRS
jgi:hypothetical protein